MFLPIFHLSVMFINMYSLWYDQMYVEIPFSPALKDFSVTLKGRYLFLTMWGLTLQTIYFAVAFLNDILGTNAPSPRRAPLIRKAKDMLFSLAFPVALYVALAFWAIYAIDKNLIFPETLAKIVPFWLNQVMHTLILPFILIELILTNRNYPTRNVGVSIIGLYTFSYVALANFVYFKTGSWAYPFLEVMPWIFTVVFFSVSIVLGLGIYVVGEKLNYLVTPGQMREVNGKAKRR